jgi:hypothetical protein
MAGALLATLSGCALFTTKDQPLSMTGGDKLPFGTGVYVVSCNTTSLEDGIKVQRISEIEVTVTEKLEKGLYSYTTTAFSRDPKFNGKTDGPTTRAFHTTSPGIYILGVPGDSGGELFFYYYFAGPPFYPLSISFDERSVERLAREWGVVLTRQPFSQEGGTPSWALQGDTEKERGFLLAVGRLPPLHMEEARRSCSIAPKS